MGGQAETIHPRPSDCGAGVCMRVGTCMQVAASRVSMPVYLFLSVCLCLLCECMLAPCVRICPPVHTQIWLAPLLTSQCLPASQNGTRWGKLVLSCLV